MLTLLLLPLLFCWAVSCQGRDAYFARLDERAATDPDGALHRHWSDFVALCDALAFERDTVHLMPLLALSHRQQDALLSRVQAAGWHASIEVLRVKQAEPLDAAIVINGADWCRCRVLALHSPVDNASNYRRHRTAHTDALAGLFGDVGREILVPGVVRDGSHCDCTSDLTVTVLRLDTRAAPPDPSPPVYATGHVLHPPFRANPGLRVEIVDASPPDFHLPPRKTNPCADL